MSGDYILIIEDDELIRRQIEKVLERAGYQSRTADSCSSGLALALDEMPRLLVLDLCLPDGTGWGLLRDLRLARPDHSPPVLVMSSQAVSRTQLRQHEVQRFVPKPFDMAYFVEVVTELLSL